MPLAAIVSVRDFASRLSAGTLGQAAQKVGLRWPSPTAVSVRDMIERFALPLMPTNLRIAWGA